jgi:ABC-type polysaccharide/polyol phosphate export permease
VTLAATLPSSLPARVRWAATDTWTITVRYLTHLLRAPERILIGLAFPIISILLFGYVFGSAIAVPDNGNYREYLIPGMFAQAMVFGIAGRSVAVAVDVARGIGDRFRSMPMSPSAVLTGQTTAEGINGVLDIVVMTICGLIVGWRFHGSIGETAAAFGLLLLLRFAVTWVGLYLGLLVRGPEGASMLTPLLFPIVMISNTFVPTGGMPAWLGTIADWNPISATVAATRVLFHNPNLAADDGSWPMQNPILAAIIWPIVITAIFLPLALRRYQRLSR